MRRQFDKRNNRLITMSCQSTSPKPSALATAGGIRRRHRVVQAYGLLGPLRGSDVASGRVELVVWGVSRRSPYNLGLGDMPTPIRRQHVVVRVDRGSVEVAVLENADVAYALLRNAYHREDVPVEVKDDVQVLSRVNRANVRTWDWVGRSESGVGK